MIEVVTIYGDAEVAISLESEGLARVPEWAPMLAAEVLSSAGEGRVVVRMSYGPILGRYYPRAVPPWDPRGPEVPCLLGEYLRTPTEPPAYLAWIDGGSPGSPRRARGAGRVYPIPLEAASWRPYRAILIPEEQYTELLLVGGWLGRPLQVVEQLSLDVT